MSVEELLDSSIRQFIREREAEITTLGRQVVERDQRIKRLEEINAQLAEEIDRLLKQEK